MGALLMDNPLNKLFARKPATLSPRKTATGTSYSSKGLVDIPKPSLDSELGSSVSVPIRELVPTLASPFQRLQAYNTMLTDAAVDVSMRAAKTPILGAKFFMEPFSDNPLDLEISEFIWSNLAEGMSSPFLNSLVDILRMYEDGYAVLEKVYEQREWAPKKLASSRNTKNFIMLKKLAVRPPSTIKEIEYDDNGGPNGIIQNAVQADKNIKEVKLDISKLMIFTYGRVGGDLTGKSLLRTAYKHWYYKDHFYKIDAIQKERHGIGVPRGTLLAGYTPEDREILRIMLRNLRANEESFIIQNPRVTIDFAELEGQPVDVISSAIHHNGMILMNVLGQFIALGLEQGSGGGRATGATASDLFMKSLKYIANLICEQINMYLIPELVVWNYPTKNFPKLSVRNIGETRDLQMLASAIANLYSQGAITPTEETEQWNRRTFDMPMFVGSWVNPNDVQTTPAPTNSKPTPDEIAALASNANSQNKKGSVNTGNGNAGNVGKAPSGNN